jgi:hypothetical protein
MFSLTQLIDREAGLEAQMGKKFDEKGRPAPTGSGDHDVMTFGHVPSFALAVEGRASPY